MNEGLLRSIEVHYLVLDTSLLLVAFFCLVPVLFLTWAASVLKPEAGDDVCELGREGETLSWDRERRRRYGRHQHKHGHHHRHRASVPI